jgi:hypothetical protein
MSASFWKYSKTIICLLAVVLLMGDTVSATLNNQTTMTDAVFLEQITIVLSWLWIPVARLAGKLMSNGFVYGEFMNFDIYLWQIWNISKNFANISIGLFFLVYIIRTIFQKDQLTGNEIGKRIGWFLIASVAIQSSWFFMWALLDIEKITTSAMGALPGMIIVNNNERSQKILSSVDDSNTQNSTISLENNNGMYKIDLKTRNWAFTPESTLDSILPRYDTLSWPLFFIGLSMFQFHRYGETEFSIDNINDIMWIFTASGIKLLTIGWFFIMMLILLIANIIRVGYLWMVIWLSPIIVLYLTLKNIIGMQIGNDSDSIVSKINIPTILAYIFQPTIIITFIWFMIVAIVWLNDNFWATSNNVLQEQWFTITTWTIEHDTFSIITKGDLFSNIQDTWKWVFQNIMLILLTFWLLLWLIVLTTSLLKIEFLQKAAKSLGTALAKVPSIPIVYGAQAWWNILRDTTGIDLVTGDPSRRGKLDTKWENAMRKLLGLDTLNDKKDDAYIRDIASAIKTPERFGEAFSAWIAHKWDTGIVLNWANATSQAKELIEKFIKENNGKYKELSRFDNDDNNKFNLSEYLKKNSNLKYIYNLIMDNNINANLPAYMDVNKFLTQAIKIPAKK